MDSSILGFQRSNSRPRNRLSCARKNDSSPYTAPTSSQTAQQRRTTATIQYRASMDAHLAPTHVSPDPLCRSTCRWTCRFLPVILIFRQKYRYGCIHFTPRQGPLGRPKTPWTLIMHSSARGIAPRDPTYTLAYPCLHDALVHYLSLGCAYPAALSLPTGGSGRKIGGNGASCVDQPRMGTRGSTLAAHPPILAEVRRKYPALTCDWRRGIVRPRLTVILV